MLSAKFVVGLTGGIGSGKSTVADLFASLGVTVIDTDQLARDVIKPGTEAHQAIIKKFGPTLLLSDQQINRKQLRELVFQDASSRVWLEKLLHPLIREAMALKIAAATSSYCIVVIPLLFETPPNPLINRTLVVDTTEDLQLARASQRDNQPTAHIHSIIKTQIAREKRLAAADDIIYNDKKLTDLIPQVEALHQFYLKEADNLTKIQ